MKNNVLIGAVITAFLTSCSLTNNARKETELATSGCVPGETSQVRGQTYRVLATAAGYQADGLATIYPHTTQGETTAMCEKLDMNGFTAAHRTLPLPAYVKITNKNNGQSVVVKVNDRGPAREQALIQVTPAIANILGENKAFPVHIEAITAKKPLVSALKPITSSAARSPVKSQLLSVKKSRADRSQADRYYIVVGTYPSRDEAFERFVRVSSIGLANVAMETRQLKGRTLHMVRLGPYYDQDEIDRAKDRLKNDGLVTFNVVKN